MPINIDAFSQNPDKYVLRVDKNERVIVEKKGFLTLIKSHTLWKDEYKLNKIITVVTNNITEYSVPFLEKLNQNIRKYNELHSNKLAEVNIAKAATVVWASKREAHAKRDNFFDPDTDQKNAHSKNIDEAAKARRRAVLEAKKLQEKEHPEKEFIKAAVWRHLEPYLSKQITPENEDINRANLPSVILKELEAKFPGKTFTLQDVTREVFTEYIYIAASEGCKVAASSQRGRIFLKTPLVVNSIYEKVRHAVAIDFKGCPLQVDLRSALTEAVDKCIKGYERGQV